MYLIFLFMGIPAVNVSLFDFFPLDHHFVSIRSVFLWQVSVPQSSFCTPRFHGNDFLEFWYVELKLSISIHINPSLMSLVNSHDFLTIVSHFCVCSISFLRCSWSSSCSVGFCSTWCGRHEEFNGFRLL